MSKSKVMEHGITKILLAVDTQSILSGDSTAYLVDDNPSGSTGEATMNLDTRCQKGDTIDWRVVSINQRDKISITQINPTSGTVFGFDGRPQKLNGIWEGFAQNAGEQTYDIQVLVGTGTFHTWSGIKITAT